MFQGEDNSSSRCVRMVLKMETLFFFALFQSDLFTSFFSKCLEWLEFGTTELQLLASLSSLSPLLVSILGPSS